MSSIPVIGCAVVNSSFWVSRLLMSVDFPVDNFVIINNNGRGELDNELDALKLIKHRYVKKITVAHMPANIGCSGAWNLIIKCYMLSPYWIIVNDDVAFGSGLLKEMHDLVNTDPYTGMIHPNKGDFGLGSWDLFLIRDFVVQQFGLFDENLYPAYCEDADYIMRFIHNPIKKIVGCESIYYHGPGKQTDYYVHGSQTQKSEPELAEKLDYSNNSNIDYLTEKWGEGWRVCSPNRVPFNGRPVSVDYTTFDLTFARKKHLGF